MALILLLYSLHLFINQISLALGNFYYIIFVTSGYIVHTICFHTEQFYQKHPEYQDKLLLQLTWFKKELRFTAKAKALLKMQLKNKGYRKFYTFIQKLKAIAIYLVFLPDKQKLENYLDHKLKTIKDYICILKNRGLFALLPNPKYANLPHNKKSIDIIRLIWQIHQDNPSFGKWRISAELCRLGILISPNTAKKYLSLPKPAEPDQKKVRKKQKYTPTGNFKRIRSKYPGHFWNCDFTTVSFFFTRFYIFFVIDLYSRRLIHFDISPFEPSAWWTVRRLKTAVAETWDAPKYIISDNGGQFISGLFKEFCKAYRIKHIRGKPGNPIFNTYIERFIKSAKQEVLFHIPFFSEEKLRSILYEYKRYYNRYRPHYGLKGLTPYQKRHKLTPARRNNNEPVNIRAISFCDNLITAYCLEKAA